MDAEIAIINQFSTETGVTSVRSLKIMVEDEKIQDDYHSQNKESYR